MQSIKRRLALLLENRKLAGTRPLVRFLKRRRGVRPEVIERLGLHNLQIGEPVSGLELACIAALWLGRLPEDEAIARFTLHLRENTVNGDFFAGVDLLVTQFSQAGFGRTADKLLRLARNAADELGQQERARSYHRKLEEREIECRKSKAANHSLIR